MTHAVLAERPAVFFACLRAIMCVLVFAADTRFDRLQK